MYLKYSVTPAKVVSDHISASRCTRQSKFGAIVQQGNYEAASGPQNERRLVAVRLYSRTFLNT